MPLLPHALSRHLFPRSKRYRLLLLFSLGTITYLYLASNANTSHLIKIGSSEDYYHHLGLDDGLHHLRYTSHQGKRAVGAGSGSGREARLIVSTPSNGTYPFHVLHATFTPTGAVQISSKPVTLESDLDLGKSSKSKKGAIEMATALSKLFITNLPTILPPPTYDPDGDLTLIAISETSPTSHLLTISFDPSDLSSTATAKAKGKSKEGELDFELKGMVETRGESSCMGLVEEDGKVRGKGRGGNGWRALIANVSAFIEN